MIGYVRRMRWMDPFKIAISEKTNEMYPLKTPQLVATGDLPSHFLSNGIRHTSHTPLNLNFGQGNDQYHLYSYPCPAPGETMGIFFEWHTEDFFAVETGPHLGVGLRGPVKEDPHRGRGLAIGILASHMNNPDDPEHPIPLFEGCPGPPGAPSFFIEDFSGNDGIAPIRDWQLSKGQPLPSLQGYHTYRIDIHVSADNVWVGIWQVTEHQNTGGTGHRSYVFLAQATCSKEASAAGGATSPCPQAILDRDRGNAFIGTAFADPETRSWVDNIFIANWRGSFPPS